MAEVLSGVINGSILEELRWDKHIMHPSCVHQLLSPNDNIRHGAACEKALEDVWSRFQGSIKLLQFIDSETYVKSGLGRICK